MAWVFSRKSQCWKMNLSLVMIYIHLGACHLWGRPNSQVCAKHAAYPSKGSVHVPTTQAIRAIASKRCGAKTLIWWLLRNTSWCTFKRPVSRRYAHRHHINLATLSMDASPRLWKTLGHQTLSVLVRPKQDYPSLESQGIREMYEKIEGF